jgi:hypothetical protein
MSTFYGNEQLAQVITLYQSSVGTSSHTVTSGRYAVAEYMMQSASGDGIMSFEVDGTDNKLSFQDSAPEGASKSGYVNSSAGQTIKIINSFGGSDSAGTVVIKEYLLP